MIKTLTLALSVLMTAVGISQAPKKYSTSEIYHSIEKLNKLKSVLYVAAHPDDENTFVISYLANEAKARTAYLSLTRGDGGQNLIGPEMKELLGVLRTQELLAARRLDGGEQMFSRANDFGFSKTSEETLEIWDKEVVLGDVVWAIRKFRPDVIINRFHHDSSGKTHGHHSASAELSYEAFDLAGNPEAYPKQLEYVDAHQPQRLFFNTSYWFYGRDRTKFEELDKSNMVKLDVGVYYPHKGISNNELAAYSRSQHVCQGMGRTPQRGTDIEYLEILKGDMPPDDKDLFSGIDTEWTRVENGASIGDAIDKILGDFDHRDAAASLPALAKVYAMIAELPPSEHWRNVKLREVEEIILATAGLYLEAVPKSNQLVPGSSVEVSIEAINRSDADVVLNSVRLTGMDADSVIAMQLTDNERYRSTVNLAVSEDTPISDPYWLRTQGSLGTYKVDDQRLVGLPESPRPLKAVFALSVSGVDMEIEKPLIHKATDRERGEVYRPVEVTLPVSVNVVEPVYIFADNTAQQITVEIKTVADNQEGVLSLPVPEGWVVEPASIPWSIEAAGAEQRFTFVVSPPDNAAVADITPIITMGDVDYDKELIKISYNHIPDQLVLREAKAKMVKLDIETRGKEIGYVIGAGDEIPASLQQIGYNVTELDVSQISKDELAKYDAVILGIRAYNKHDDIKYKQELLWDYAESGGTLITQYTTTWGSKVDQVMPIDLKISRQRVTVEEAEVRILAPQHPMMTSPNEIGPSDFDGWVQERGLYFASEWDKAFVPLLSSNDPGEEPRDGGTLVAQYGEGYLVYTGYSWFRQLPAGVPGAYRLFANMVSQTPKVNRP